MLQYYFNKYCKYKTKYLQLKGGNFTNENTNLYIKFITEKLVALLDTDIKPIIGGNKKRKNEIPEDEKTLYNEPKLKTSRIITKPSYLKDYFEDLTPEIYRYLSPLSKERIINDMEIDDNIIKILTEIQEEKDPEYVAYENHGKLIECWIADNMTCPCCGQNNSLRRYLSDSMPVIDIVCINPEHTIQQGVKFFQVKTSNGTPFLDKPYFLYDDTNTKANANTIHVGSRRYGQETHTIIPQDSLFKKKILCGYICIVYTETETSLRINFINSFIVLPKIINTIKKTLIFDTTETVETDENKWYYKYIEPTKTHQRIQFNTNTNNIITADNLKKLIPQQLNKSYVIKTLPMDNPLNIFIK